MLLSGITSLIRKRYPRPLLQVSLPRPITFNSPAPRSPEISSPSLLPSGTWILTTGLFLVLMGQSFRSLAMIHASSNFSHQIALHKDPSHTLVTSGVYSLVRHPSYFGFFWWAVGLQVFLANPVSTVIFVGVLWRFFSERIKYAASSHLPSYSPHFFSISLQVALCSCYHELHGLPVICLRFHFSELILMVGGKRCI